MTEPDSLTEPESVTEPELATEPDPASGVDQADDGAGDPDRTDELPRADGRPPVRQADDDHDDLLRTTAQLSVLMDDLDDQGR